MLDSCLHLDALTALVAKYCDFEFFYGYPVEKRGGLTGSVIDNDDRRDQAKLHSTRRHALYLLEFALAFGRRR